MTAAPAPKIDPQPRLRTVLVRGWRRKCPRCGEGPLFKKWLTLHDNCPVCGLQLVKGQGDLWGYLLLVDRAVFIFPLIVVIYFRVYNPNSLFYYLLIGGLLGVMILTMPQRNGMSVGLDYLCRLKWGDLAEGDPASETASSSKKE